MPKPVINTEENDISLKPRFDPVWLGSCAAITAIAIFLRFYQLGLKPFHHDEGVNGWFLTNLFRDGIYKYDPANYHGPTLYYISLAFAYVFGLETVPVRWSVAIWGVLMVALAFFLRPHIGRVGSLFAGFFLALSPGMVFISRYFIHEIFFVFLSLGVAVSVVYFIERRKPGPMSIGWTALNLLVCFLPSTLKLASFLAGEASPNVWYWRAGVFAVEAVLVFFVIRMLLGWNEGRPIYFLLAAACVALMFATKETAFITLGTMLIACFCVWLWLKIHKPANAETANDDDISDGYLTWPGFRRALGERGDLLLVLAAAAAVFLYICIVFFSSFFTYPEGVKGAVEAYAIWTKTGSKDHTQNGFLGYLWWGLKIEAPILILSAIGAGQAFYKAQHRFAMFAALWAFGLFLAYSIIPYKTPWLALSFLLPMCIAAGYAINELLTSKNGSLRILGIIFAAAACIVLAYQTWQINFIRYDDEEMPYVYAHTKREFLDLVAEIERYAAKSGRGRDAKIQIVSPDYWPLVWYLKDYKHAGFHGRFADADGAEMIVAKKGDQDAEVIRRYSANYEYAGSYALRPGVDLLMLVRKDLAEENAKELYRIPESK